MKIKVIVATLVAVMLVPVLAMAGSVVVIGNSSVPVSSLSKQDISDIFLGKKTTLNDGSTITFVIQQKNSVANEVFLKAYIHKTPTQFSNYWKRQVFTGKASSPKSLDGDQAIIKFVSETEGAVGYVSSGTNLNNVKTISVR